MVNVFRCAVLALLTVSVAMGQDRDQLDAGVNALFAEQPQNENAADDVAEPLKLEFRVAETEPGAVAQADNPFPEETVRQAELFGSPDNWNTSNTSPNLQLQLRFAETEFHEGLTKADITGSNSAIYLSPKPLATVTDHLLKARVMPEESGPRIILTLTSSGATVFKQALENSPDKQIALTMGGDDIVLFPVAIDHAEREASVIVSSLKVAFQIREAVNRHRPDRKVELLLRRATHLAPDDQVRTCSLHQDELLRVVKVRGKTMQWVLSSDGKRKYTEFITGLTPQYPFDVILSVNGRAINVAQGKHVDMYDSVTRTHSFGFQVEFRTPAEMSEAAWILQPPREQASLIILQADWSQSPSAAMIKQELHEALAGTGVSSDLIDRLPQSGPEILFNRHNVSTFTPRQFSELCVWLVKHQLIRALPHSMEFGATPESLSVPALALGNWQKYRSVISTQAPDRPFTTRQLRFDWIFQSATDENDNTKLNLSRYLIIETSERGQPRPENTTVEMRGVQFPTHDHHVAVLHAFWRGDDVTYHEMARERKILPLIAITRGTGFPSLDAEPRLHLPTIVQGLKDTHSPVFANETAVSSGQNSSIQSVSPTDFDALRDESQKANQQAKDVAKNYHSVQQADSPPTESEVMAARTVVTKAVRRAYELRQQLHLAEIKRMQEKLTRAEATVKQRRDQQEQIIRRRVDELLNPTLTWDSF